MEGKRDDRDRNDRDDEEEDGEEKRKNPFWFSIVSSRGSFSRKRFFLRRKSSKEVRSSIFWHGVDCSMNTLNLPILS
jgi:hypothetical protein